MANAPYVMTMIAIAGNRRNQPTVIQSTGKSCCGGAKALPGDLAASDSVSAKKPCCKACGGHK